MEANGDGATKETLRYPSSFGNVYLDCVGVTILVVIEYYTFLRCLPLKKLGKSTWKLSLLFLISV